MEWTYTIVKPFTVNTRNIYDVTKAMTLSDLCVSGSTWSFNPGPIDQHLYDSLVKGYPDCVKREPKNQLVAAIYAARGMR